MCFVCVCVCACVRCSVCLVLRVCAEHMQHSHYSNITLSPQEVVAMVREHVPALSGDRFIAPDIAAVTELLRSGRIADVATSAESDDERR